MKKLILIAFLFLSLVSFSQRVMTQEEKQSLSTNSIFQEKCKQAIRDYATYWAVHDGASLGTEVLRIKWAKDRQLAVIVLKNPIISEDSQTMAWIFLNAAKGKTYSIGTAPIDAATLITAWESASSFDEFASIYYDVKGDEINFSIGN
jgi:hypothetical protein